ncbi:hypothetical protein [Pedosphaera parvula]|uniref:Lipoprotein n=1 Tax=Pedosphaera parvula (strain Ellin514) TaxID=320771 RepID=B9X9X7_PEDPL|nr:hypothetical protein [Pedosphaera parvula]EEF63318.1 hypothetical protein Cflav_PD5953 [Pedosphaera parvula Ellin514]
MKNKIISVVSLVSLTIGMVVASAGCHSTATTADQKYSAWEVETFKKEAQSHQDVVLVCIYENQLQRMPLPHKHRVNSKATVVRSYKGAWQVGEPIAFYRVLESVPQDWKPNVGHLVYLLFDKHTPEPVGIDTGEDWAYKPEFERALRSVPSSSAKERRSRSGE